MSEYVLKINKGNKNINKLIKTEGYTFNPKNDIVKSFTLMYEYKKFIKKEEYEKFLNNLIRYEKFLNQNVLYREVNKESGMKR